MINIKFTGLLCKKIIYFYILVISASTAIAEVNLNDVEKQWVKNNPVVTFTGDPNWLPYEAFEADGKYIGIVSEHLKLVETLTGLKFSAIPTSNWTESLTIATEGKVSVISGDAADVILNKRFKPIQSYSKNKIVIIMDIYQNHVMDIHKNYVEDLNEIKDQRIAIIKDYGYTADIFKHYPDIKFLEVENIQEGLEGVASGHYDAMLATFALATYTIPELGLHNIKVVGKTTVVMDLTLFVDKKQPVLHSIINKALQSISLSDSNAISQRWIKQHYVEKIDYSLVYKVVFFAVVIIVIFLVWNRSLTSEIRLRRKTEKELNKLKKTLDQTLDCVFIFDAADLKFTYVNAGAIQQVGYTAEELENMHPYDIKPLLNSSEFAVLIQPLLLNEKSSINFETVHQHKNGEKIQVEVFLQYIKDNNHFIAIVRDITERKNIDAILRSLASGNSTLNFSSFMSDVLVRLTHLYGCKYAFIGEIQDDRENIKTLAVRVGDEEVDNFEYHLDGTPCQDILNFHAELIPKNVASLYPSDKLLVDMGVESYFGAPLISSSGSLIGILTVMDTEEMKLDEWTEPVLGVFAKRVALELERENISVKLNQYQDQLEEKVKIRTADFLTARNEAQKANDAKSEFLSSMSHELRTPLNAILGFAQMLELDASAFSDVQKGNVKEILSAGEHLLELINQVLNLTHIESGKVEINMEKVRLTTVVEECLKLTSDSISKRKINIVDKVSEHNYVVRADSLRLKQVLLNLMSNAIKYNVESGQVVIDSKKLAANRLQIIISDTGKGLTGDELSRLFDPFERFHDEENIEGTGIGLTITKHLCELMGCNVKVESIPGEGTQFSIDLEYCEEAAVA